MGQLVERPAQASRQHDGHHDRQAGGAQSRQADDTEHPPDPRVGRPGRRLQADHAAGVGVGLGDQVVAVPLRRAGEQGGRARWCR